MRAVYPVIIAALVLACALQSHAASSRYSLWLTAHPQSIPADSHSSTTISAEVRDSSGSPAPDGTAVEFTSSLGVIEQRSRTIAGVARVRLESGSAIGTATISAVAPDGGAVGDLRVEFLEPGTDISDESFISISSKNYLGYDVDRQVVDSAGGVRIEHRGLTIDAEEAQLDVRKNIVRVHGRPGHPMVIKRGGKKVAASLLVYDLSSMRGVLMSPADLGAARMTFRGTDLHTSTDYDPDRSLTFDFEPIAESKLFIRAKSILIRPGEDIRFKRANYYADGEKVLSLPLQVVPLKNGGVGASRMLAYGTEGLRLDVPFYYSLTPNAAGSVRLKHSQQTGWGSYSDQSGWQVDLDHEYNFGGSEQGTFTVNRITSARDWGQRWNHRVLFDNDSQIYSYFDFPSHRNLFGSVDYSRPMRNYTWSTSLRGNKYRGTPGGYFAGTYLQSRSKPLIGNAVNYSFSTRLSYDNRQLGGRELGTGLGLQFYGKPLQFGRYTSVSTSISTTRDWGGGSPGLSVYATAGLSHLMGTSGFVGLL